MLGTRFWNEFENRWQPFLFDNVNDDNIWKTSLKKIGNKITKIARNIDIKGTTIHFIYELYSKNSLRFRNINNNNIKWRSGNISAFYMNSKPSDGVYDVGGLTKMEYTIPNDGTASVDISAVDGFNIDVDLRYYNAVGTNFDDTKQVSCKILDTLQSNPCPGGINDYRCKTPTVKEMNAESFQNQILRDDPLSCTNNIETDCAGCPTGHNLCSKNAKPYSKCDLFEKQKKWGCYRFWYDPNNESAIKWLDRFKRR